jgi:hypothetical protein
MPIPLEGIETVPYRSRTAIHGGDDVAYSIRNDQKVPIVTYDRVTYTTLIRPHMVCVTSFVAHYNQELRKSCFGLKVLTILST